MIGCFARNRDETRCWRGRRNAGGEIDPELAGGADTGRRHSAKRRAETGTESESENGIQIEIEVELEVEACSGPLEPLS